MILIGTDSGIYRWFEDCGWPIFHSLQDRAIVGLASPGAGVLAVLDREGTVLESVNNGLDWRMIPRPEGSGIPTALAISGAEESELILATRPLGLYLRAVGAPVPQIEHPAARGFAPELLSRATALLAPRTRTTTADPEEARLAGWTRLGIPNLSGREDTTEVRALAFGAESPAPWYAALRGAGLWQSRDEGTTWQPCPGLPAEVFAVRTVPERPGSVYTATSDGCWISSDGGTTWEDRSGGLEQTRSLSALEVKPGAPDILLAGAAPGTSERAALFESTNGGKTWTQVKRGVPEILENDSIADIRHDPVAPDNIIVAFASGELWVTRNGGAYWGPLARQIHAARALCAVG